MLFLIGYSLQVVLSMLCIVVLLSAIPRRLFWRQLLEESGRPPLPNVRWWTIALIVAAMGLTTIGMVGAIFELARQDRALLLLLFGTLYVLLGDLGRLPREQKMRPVSALEAAAQTDWPGQASAR